METVICSHLALTIYMSLGKYLTPAPTRDSIFSCVKQDGRMNQLIYGRDTHQDLSHGASSVAVVVVTFHRGFFRKVLLEEVFRKVLRSNRCCCITLIQLYL